MTTISLSEAAKVANLLRQDRLSYSKRQVIVFDLDNTLIDSSHRARNKPDGSYDLEYWRKHSTWEYISKDTLLPAYFDYLNFRDQGYTIVAVTAREMDENDHRYLEEHGLEVAAILSRGDSKELDHVLKHRLLDKFFYVDSETPRLPFLFYDDKPENLEVAKKYNFIPVNAVFRNLASIAKDFYSVRNPDLSNITQLKPKTEDIIETKLQIVSKDIAVGE